MDEYKESEASKLIKRLMDEEGFTFSEAVKEAMRQEKEFESKADGGAIGIEVLFKEKMKDGGRAGFFMGGPALEGTALNIYNSMNAYGFTDQEIANALQERGLYTPGGSTPDTPDTPDTGIINSYKPNDRSFTPGAPSSLIADYETQTQERQKRLANPNKATQFFNKLTGGGQASIAEMIRTGQVDQRKLAGIPTVGNIIGKALPDKYYDMSLGDQVFTQSQMGYDGPTVFGENLGNQDPFGLNVRSMFGNYAEAVAEDFAKLSESLSATGAIGGKKDFQGATFNEVTGEFESDTLSPEALAALNQRTKMVRTKFNFRKDQLAAKNKLDAQIKAAEKQRQEAQKIQDELAAAAAAKDRAAALAAIQKQGRQDYNPSIHGRTDYGRDSGGAQSFDFGGGFGIGSDGGPVSNRTGRGRTGYSEGGLATMFRNKR